jgi:diketogulonate reductase-like aldo/keto reductase
MTETHFTLKSNTKLPKVFMGTYGIRKDHLADLTATAVKNGYRGIDTAELYGNEEFIGEGLSRVVGTVVQRDELCIVTKVWGTHFRDVKSAL